MISREGEVCPEEHGIHRRSQKETLFWDDPPDKSEIAHLEESPKKNLLRD